MDCCAGLLSLSLSVRSVRTEVHLSCPPPPDPQAVYHMPTNENDDASKSLPLALQSLFYKAGRVESDGLGWCALR